MDFELSDDQEALAEGVAALCEGRFDIDAVRAMADNGLDRGRWTELAETGVFSLCLSEADGGVGLGWAEAAVVFEQLGKTLVPGPLVATTLAAGLVDGAADGSVVVASVERTTGPAVIEHLGWADVLVIVDDDGLASVAVPELDATPHAQPLDPLTPVWTVAELPAGDRIGDAGAAASWRLRGSMLTAALQLGLAIGATDLAVAYAKEREQFGKPIGAFQAVKHRCADMITRVEVLRAAVYAAAVTLDGNGVDEPERTVAVAKILASHAAAMCGKDCVQIHGGMGYTWEVNAHLFLKRAWVHDLAFGDGDDLAGELARELAGNGAD
ncbi:MAG: acyl-CoA/acyl-ACP dehydrogenase [Acidimicrobiales bacterium]|jgi:alkylation response protein AidB-like acyl-CoA dehydrogenase|nr:acyl-CoA/acyl-ACP dehydrogenase [Acidimicrobiales bacterium]